MHIKDSKIKTPKGAKIKQKLDFKEKRSLSFLGVHKYVRATFYNYLDSNKS